MGVQFWSLKGFVPYEETRALQLALLEARAAGRVPDTLLFLEHEPVITRGRGLQFTGVPRQRQMPLLQPLPHGIQFSESERGGDLTYHGPGQLVIYPIFKLDGQGWAPQNDVAGFVRKLEQVFIDELKEHGIKARSQKDATGIWIENKKVGSIGIAVRKWVTYHGVAINFTADLTPFQLISPCGFSSEVMACLTHWISLSSNWREEWERAVARRFGLETTAPLVESLSLKEALSKVSEAAEKI